MGRPASILPPAFVFLSLACAATGWWGCAKANQGPPTDTSTTSGSGGMTTTGGTTVSYGGGGGLSEAGACTSLSASAEHIKLDVVFLIDRSGSMTGTKWVGTTNALTTFFNDPASAGIGAGMVYFPNYKVSNCIPEDYQTLDVPIDTLPANAFTLTNSMPADATGVGTPLYGALKGALRAASAHQDAYPTHKVIVVLATDGEPNFCGSTTIDDIAGLAKSARNYNGVLTYVIGVSGSDITTLNEIAAQGGTTAAYDITTDISQFAAKAAEIRNAALACQFDIPPPPNGMSLDLGKVNFSYTPKGVGTPKILLRVDGLGSCNSEPGWYYEGTKIVLCPASCDTVQNDGDAKVDVLFGCDSLLK